MSQAWYDAETFYTMNVVLSKPTEDGLKALSYTNLIGSALPSIRSQVWNQGLAYTMPATGVIELIAPALIKQVLIIPQKTGKI